MPHLLSIIGLFAAGLLAIIAIIAIVHVFVSRRQSEGNMLILSALGLFCTSTLLQAPALYGGISQLHPGLPQFDSLFVRDTRFFYLVFTALTLLLALPLARLPASVSKLKNLSVATTMVLIGFWIWTSHRTAHEYSHASRVSIQLMRSALDAVEQHPRVGGQCEVYFLDAPDNKLLFFTSTIDAAIKALSPDLQRVARCRFQTANASWFYLLPRHTLRLDNIAPMSAVYNNGKPEPWLEVGDMQVAYLNLNEKVDATTLRDAIFFAWDGHRFIDITDDVLAGRRKVTFRCLRQADQCERFADTDTPP
jgi:hypothetical protein